ncbi:MAG: ubiquinol-cytochrome c reductase iron-sulfur subunit [Gammaproteobacteria bacterium]|nr:ubiquinol-cytochrome c reductase iron-sulfur subunit [Gammaproteobacteria bacterium]MDH3506703.1 ubiquinol-cytochrome c reductase iron-sulfur subunit [Gammaproteobacteria bacterium]
MSDNADLERRHFLTAATTIAGGVGIVGAAIPFVASFNPSARARALGAPVEVDISKVEPGALIKVEWRGRAVMILNRTEAMLDSLGDMMSVLADPGSEVSLQPDFAANEHRSLRPEILVVEGVCTHLGCAPIPRFEVAPADLGADWVGGFYCPCHGSKFDLSGRVFSGVPAPTNLTVPPYSFLSDGTLLIGSEAGAV